MPCDYSLWAMCCPENEKPSLAEAKEGQPKF